MEKQFDPLNTSLASSQPSLTALDLDLSGDDSRSNDDLHSNYDDDDGSMRITSLEESQHFQLEESLLREMEHRDRTIVRRASTRLDAFAIRSLQSRRSLLPGSPLAVDATGSLAPWTKENKSNNNNEEAIDIEGTVRSIENMYTTKNGSGLQQHQTGIYLRQSRLTGSIRRTMSMIVKPEHSRESGKMKKWIRIVYNILIFFLAFWGLFMEDLNILLLPASMDSYVLIVSWCVFGLFFIEVLVFALFLPGYHRSEQMWMETLAVISLLPLGSQVIILYGTIENTPNKYSNTYDGSELRYTLSLASTIRMILQPIRAASMANRTALSGAKLIEYTSDLLDGAIDIATSPSPKRMNSASLEDNQAIKRHRSLDPDPFTHDKHHVKAFHDNAAAVHSQNRRDSIGVFNLLKPDHHTPKRSYSGVLGSGGGGVLNSGGSNGNSGNRKDRRNSQVTADSSTTNSSSKKRNRRRSSILSKILRRSSSGNLSIQGDEEGEEDDLKTSMLGKALLARTNLNVLVGLIVVMPAIGLLKTFAIDLFPQQGLKILHEMNCMDPTRLNNITHLKRSASSYTRVAEHRRHDQRNHISLTNTIDDTITINPSYQILSIQLCGNKEIYDPFRIHETMNITTKTPLQRSTMISSHLNIRPSEVWHIELTSTTNSQSSNPSNPSNQPNPSEPLTPSSVTVSLRSVRVSDAMFSVVLTLTLLSIVVVWSSAFTYDYRILITKPLHHIIHLLRRLASNPRLAVDFGVQQRDNHQRLSVVNEWNGGGPPKKNGRNSNLNDSGGGKGDGSMQITSEIQIIEASIAKFGRLLHVGFGEAGVTIIARNLLRGKFDPVQPGVKITAIFGFCDIRNFTDCCEVLREAVMIFTNQIARIVHSSVHASGGDVNKNIGDAFLAVWKLSEEDNLSRPLLNSNPETKTPSNRNQRNTNHLSSSSGGHRNLTIKTSPGDTISPQVHRLHKNHMESIDTTTTNGSAASMNTTHTTESAAMRRGSTYVHHLTKDPTVPDKALKSFLDIIFLLDRSPGVQMYAKSSALQAKLPGFRVRMGFGLHLGWGIEGAIGTRHKIDASYLSPHVNMSARLEAATKQYGVGLLLTDVMQNELSIETQHKCRPLDCVTVKGSSVPVTLFTHDISPTGRQSCLALPGTTYEEHKLMMSKMNIKNCLLTYENFNIEWRVGFDAYISGDWSVALLHFDKCYEMRCWDSPVKVLIKYIRGAGIKSENGVLMAPNGWKGFRSLNSK